MALTTTTIGRTQHNRDVFQYSNKRKQKWVLDDPNHRVYLLRITSALNFYGRLPFQQCSSRVVRSLRPNLQVNIPWNERDEHKKGFRHTWNSYALNAFILKRVRNKLPTFPTSFPVKSGEAGAIEIGLGVQSHASPSVFTWICRTRSLNKDEKNKEDKHKCYGTSKLFCAWMT